MKEWRQNIKNIKWEKPIFLKLDNGNENKKIVENNWRIYQINQAHFLSFAKYLGKYNPANKKSSFFDKGLISNCHSCVPDLTFKTFRQVAKSLMNKDRDTIETSLFRC